MSPQNTHVTEVVTYSLNAGVTDQACMAVVERIGTWAASHPGFVSRQVCKGEDGSWVDITVWDSAENASTSQNSFMEQDFAMEMIGMIDKDSFSMVHRPVVWQQA